MWEKEKLLIMRNFSISCSVFQRHMLQTCKNKGLFRKELTDNNFAENKLTLSQTSPDFYMTTIQVFRKHCGKKEKLFVWGSFSFSQHVFYYFGELSTIIISFEICVCKLFLFGRVLFGKGLTFTQNIRYVFHRLENTVGKVENAGIFFFSQNVFRRPFPQKHQKSSLRAKGLIHYHITQLLTPLEKSFRKHCGKRRKCC